MGPDYYWNHRGCHIFCFLVVFQIQKTDATIDDSIGSEKYKKGKTDFLSICLQFSLELDKSKTVKLDISL